MLAEKFHSNPCSSDFNLLPAQVGMEKAARLTMRAFAQEAKSVFSQAGCMAHFALQLDGRIGGAAVALEVVAILPV